MTASMFGLCVVTDRAVSGGRRESEVAEMAFAGSADAVEGRFRT